MRQKRKKRNKKEDQRHFFKMSAGCYLFGTILSLSGGKWLEKGGLSAMGGMGTLFAFLAGTLFLGMASTDGTEFLLAEPWEPATEEVMEELKKRLEEARKRIETGQKEKSNQR